MTAFSISLVIILPFGPEPLTSLILSPLLSARRLARGEILILKSASVSYDLFKDFNSAADSFGEVISSADHCRDFACNVSTLENEGLSIPSPGLPITATSTRTGTSAPSSK